MISVIVPVYNCEKYLKRCLDSILCNSYGDIEVLCINDGSTDESSRILYEYALIDDRIKIFNKKNGGLSSARNVGIKECKGEFLTFIDADDWVHPHYFEILFNAAVNEETDAVICCFQESDNMDEVKLKIHYPQTAQYTKTIEIQEFLSNSKYKSHRVYACGVLYKKELIFSLFPEGIKVIEDNLFNIMNVTTYSKVTIINLPIYFYFQNSDSIMHTYTCSDAFKGLIWACEYLNAEKSVNLKVKSALIEFIYKRCMFYRYAFTKILQKNEAEQYAGICKNLLLNLDKCISIKKRMVFRSFMKFPVLYSLYKLVKGDVIDARILFSLAEIKRPI